MSYVVSLKRKISEAELRAALEGTDKFRLGAEREWGFEVTYLADSEAHVIFANGELEATSPDEELYKDLEQLAAFLGAEIVLEDEHVHVSSEASAAPVTELVLFWPVLAVVLGMLLIWRW